LAGAGIGTLEVDASIAPECRTVNAEVRIVEVSVAEGLARDQGDFATTFRVGLLEGDSYRWAPDRSVGLSDEAGLVTFDPVCSGASAARWILARILGTECDG
jgi:hypothetical protein